ncbi:MAG: serine/threonine protein kinase [Deltaproteobacteria bacterium]|nr:serine/threonine protein kinase [Deltaproteobacteria bacterium]
MEGPLALIMIFGMPVFIVGITQYFKFKRLRLERETAQLPAAERLRLEAAEKDRALLERRVQNLETIVTSVDLELNARLNRLAAEQSRLALAPPVPRGTHAEVAAAEATAKTSLLAHEASSGELPLGSVLLGRFQVERTLGRGGMGAVYLATDRQMGEQVALKVIARNLSDDPAAAERFRREASSARKVTHPNVIRIHDLGEAEGLLFLSMEYFPGLTLAELLSRRRHLPLDETRALVGQICDALAAAHQAGVIHRDLKPQNVLVNERGELRVIDFGLAKASFFAGMTATGLILGTPEYMAPEQVRGQPMDARTDVYALGAMTYHLLCGRPPFVADSPIAVGFLHCSEEPLPPSTRRTELPAAVDEPVLRALAKDPARRFATVLEFKRAF